MIVYSKTKNNFMSDVDNDLITNAIYDKYREFFGKSNKSQIRSWKESMQYMYKVLNDKEIPSDAGIAIEFNIPSTSKRIDFLITGFNQDDRGSVIIVELKQWEKCELILNKDGLVSTYVGGGIREVTHPSYQAYSYAAIIDDFNETVQKENINLYPCAYLHNYKIWPHDPLLNNHYQEYLKLAPSFGMGDVIKLRNFIKNYVKKGDNKTLLYKIENGRIRPSKRLQDSLGRMLKGNKEFIMIDEQKIVYEQALDLYRQTKKDKKKRVLVVNGGPGTGKSVLAINLLVQYTKQNLVVNYVTKNSAPRNVFYYKLKGDFKAHYIKNLFKGSSAYINTEKNIFDVLIADEAHRLNAKSGMFKNLGENQIKEIINASKLSIFFLDDRQKVTIEDIGDLNLIKNYAKNLKAEVYVTELNSQFRCNGSDGYLSWLDNILGISKTANFNFEEDYHYDFKIFDNPNELKKAILEKNKNNKSRLVAGYCWDWISSGKNRSDIYDIEIPEYHFKMSWNLGNSQTWAIDENSVSEIGCIHTCQGLEFDYVGVIIGEDIRYKNGEIITDYSKRAKTDQSLKGIKKIAKDNQDKANKIADQIIKNTYRTLMTRGMKGCYVYCMDKELEKYLKKKAN